MTLCYKRKLMILKKSIEIQLQKTTLKIGFISIAYQNTVVYTRIDKVGFAESIVHVDNTGQILYELNYNCIIGQFGLLGSRRVIIANNASNTIDIINLQKKEVYSRSHNFINEIALSIDMICFFENSIVAIAELNNNRKNQQLTFYDFSSENIEANKQICLSLGKKRAHIENKIVKLNDKSKIAIYQRKNYFHFVFDVYELMKDKTVNQHRVKIEMPQNIGYLYLENIWQTQQNHFLIFGSKCIDDQDRIQTQGQFKRWTNSKNYDPTFIMLNDGYAEQKQWLTSDQLEENKLAIYKILLLKHTLVLKCVTNDEKSPTYYIDTTGQTALITDFDNSCTEKGKFITQYNELEYLQAQFHLNGIDKTKITSTMMTTKKDVLLHFMLCLNEDFDDDLLQDALELLEEII